MEPVCVIYRGTVRRCARALAHARTHAQANAFIHTQNGLIKISLEPPLSFLPASSARRSFVSQRAPLDPGDARQPRCGLPRNNDARSDSLNGQLMSESRPAARNEHTISNEERRSEEKFDRARVRTFAIAPRESNPRVHPLKRREVDLRSVDVEPRENRASLFVL